MNRLPIDPFAPPDVPLSGKGAVSQIGGAKYRIGGDRRGDSVLRIRT